jgi:NAD+ diphosphatase
MRHIKPARPNPYSGGALDRAAHLREDEAFLAQAATDPASRVTYVWQGKHLLSGREAPTAHLLPVPGDETPTLFLGLHENTALFAHDLSAQAQAPDLGGGAFHDLRGIASLLRADHAAILATARGMLHWHATHRFCPSCGNTLRPIRGGWVLHCDACGRDQFPRTDPAVIMLITRGDKLLLGQSHRFPRELNFYSTLAGFVEPGEALEDAVRREVFEEVGIRVGGVEYHSSQPWPFPASLMLGFRATAGAQREIRRGTELEDVQWYSRADLRSGRVLLPPPQAIAHRLIGSWLDEG